MKTIDITSINPRRVNSIDVPVQGEIAQAEHVEQPVTDLIALIKSLSVRIDAMSSQVIALTQQVALLETSVLLAHTRIDSVQTGATAPAPPTVEPAGTTADTITVDVTPVEVTGTVEYTIYPEYKRSVDTIWAAVGEANDIADGSVVQIDVSGLTAGTSYDFRARVKASSPASDEYSLWATATNLTTATGDPQGGGFNGGSGVFIKPLPLGDLPVKSDFRVIPKTVLAESIFEITAEAGTEWEYQLALNTGDTADWSVAVGSGSLPTWLSLTTGGLLSGTPPPDDMNRQYSFSVVAETATAIARQNFVFRVLSGAESSNAVLIATTYGSVIDVQPRAGSVYGSGNIKFSIDWGDGQTGVYETDRMYMASADKHSDLVADGVLRHVFSGNFANPSTLKTIRMEILEFQGTDAFFNPSFFVNYFSQSSTARGVKTVDVSQNRYSPMIEIKGSLDFGVAGIIGEKTGDTAGTLALYTHVRFISNYCTGLMFPSGWADRFVLPNTLYNNHPTLRIYINLQYCSLTQAQVDAVLSGVNTASPTYSGTNKPVLVLSNNAAPSSTGLAAKAALEGKNWTVVTS